MGECAASVGVDNSGVGAVPILAKDISKENLMSGADGHAYGPSFAAELIIPPAPIAEIVSIDSLFLMF